MSKSTYAAALEKIEHGKVSSAYMFLGDNYYQRFLLTEKILIDRIPRGQRAYNKTEIAGQKASPEILQQSLFGVPLLGGKTVVVVTDLNRIPEKGQQFLLKALASLDPSITFIGSANKLDGRKVFTKTLSEFCDVVELKELNNKALPPYVRSRFVAHGLQIDREGVNEICRIVGRDCGDIEQEAGKASIRFGKGSSLRLDDIKNLLSSSRQYSRYEVTGYLGNKQTDRALASLGEVIRSGGAEERGLLWVTYQQLQRMLLFKKYAGSMRSQDLAGKLRTPVWVLDELGRQCDKWSVDQLTDAFMLVYQAEVAERFTMQPRGQIWERAFISILQENEE
jgi:DNA polymerase III delta subunit